MKHPTMALFAFILVLTALAAAAAPSAEKEETEERMTSFNGDRRDKRQAPDHPDQGPAQGVPPPPGAPCTKRRCEPTVAAARNPGRPMRQEGMFDREFHE